ncbi:hypothetical protein BC628DRAFT_601435 [Trametes gibbosa]|nr:hypothetical protein BC628DRAFT_601435 [Trametes gibbosa]
MSPAAIQEQLRRLTHSIAYKPPYCQGTCTPDGGSFPLYYGRDANARRLDLANASSEELQHLAEACNPATFGRGQQDVHDETYRKAGKLDTSEFMLGLPLDNVGLLDIIRTELLLEGRTGTTRDLVRAELYKLNVYGPQSFFKPHVDTPRSELMFGSLVIVFPTPHEGGALVLREHKGEQSQEWTFDPATLLAEATRPSLAYVAFYSDVEHEVMPVKSGYRVTITYNLYRVKEDSAGITPIPIPHSMNNNLFRDTLRGLLDNPSFLPDAASRTEGRQALRDVASRLKGTDALVYRTVHELSLQSDLKIVYQSDDEGYLMCNQVVDLSAKDLETSLHTQIMHAGGEEVDPFWVASSPFSVNATSTTYIAYGNETTIGHAYWKLSLLVPVGKFGDRLNPHSRYQYHPGRYCYYPVTL